MWKILRNPAPETLFTITLLQGLINTKHRTRKEPNYLPATPPSGGSRRRSTHTRRPGATRRSGNRRPDSRRSVAWRRSDAWGSVTRRLVSRTMVDINGSPAIITPTRIRIMVAAIIDRTGGVARTGTAREGEGRKNNHTTEYEFYSVSHD